MFPCKKPFPTSILLENIQSPRNEVRTKSMERYKAQLFMHAFIIK